MIGARVAPFGLQFFDRDSVAEALAPGEKAALSKFGAFVRTGARSSLRYGTKTSSPGDPPTIHQSIIRRKTNRKTGVTTPQSVSPLRELLFFGYDASTKSTVVGPALFNSGKKGAGISQGDTVPGTIERGGSVLIGKKTVKLAARPFMGPALQRELPKFTDLFKGIGLQGGS